MAATTEPFLGPWELFEVLEDEFATIHGTAVEPDHPGRWSVEPGDIRDVEAVDARIEALKLVPPPATPPGAPREPRSKEALAKILDDALAMAPVELAERCERYLSGDRGRALRNNARLVPENGTQRFNRQVIDVAFAEIVESAADRELRRLFERVDGGGAAPPRWALCLSGGGIRSASFALGVIQALGRERLVSGRPVLEHFHYLSTVSGGGYIGSWLSAWMARAGRGRVLEELARESWPGPLQSEPTPVQYLRQYSNFLAPRKGVTSADAWTLAATVIRNLLLTWLVLLPVVAVALMVPLLLAAVAARPPESASVRGALELAMLAGSGLALMTGVWFVHSRRPDHVHDAARRSGGGGDAPVSKRRDQRAFVQWCLVPLTLGTILLVIPWMWETEAGANAITPRIRGIRLDLLLPAAAAAVHSGGWMFAVLRSGVKPKPREFALIPLTGAVAGYVSVHAGAFVHAGSAWLGRWMLTASPTTLDDMLHLTGDVARPAEYADVVALGYVVLAVPSFLLAITLGGFLFVGIGSKWQYDEEREWSARYSAWLLVAVVTWLVVGVIVFASGLVLDGVHGLLLGGAAGGTGWLAAMLGKSSKTSAAGGTVKSGAMKGVTSMLHEHALTVVSTVAVILVLMTMAALDTTLVKVVPGPEHAVWRIGLVAAIIGLIGVATSRSVDVNKFSLHAMYRARLIRAYLGASREPGTRQPDPFTGFDPADNVSMHQLRGSPASTRAGAPPGPIHVVNVALNMVAGSDLAWQDRKARSFTVTPTFAGAYGVGYRRTRLDRATAAAVAAARADADRAQWLADAAGKEGAAAKKLEEEAKEARARADRIEKDARLALYAGEDGISLGTAMAISGAAASPNMGYYSSPAVTFLMTLFNARLGWWLGNPGWAGGKKVVLGGERWHQRGPIFHTSNPSPFVPPIFRELVGLTTDSESMIYLSDGGHFENLGLYEMVLRRCRVIVVVDASCDENCDLADLGNAIRRVRVDLGVPIEFEHPFPILPRKPGEKYANGSRHTARARVRYGLADAGSEDGILIYVKPALSGDEPEDVFSYAQRGGAFPHESTIDQFFSESQFESYRALGSHSGDELCDALPTAKR